MAGTSKNAPNEYRAICYQGAMCSLNNVNGTNDDSEMASYKWCQKWEEGISEVFLWASPVTVQQENSTRNTLFHDKYNIIISWNHSLDESQRRSKRYQTATVWFLFKRKTRRGSVGCCDVTEWHAALSQYSYNRNVGVGSRCIWWRRIRCRRLSRRCLLWWMASRSGLSRWWSNLQQ